VSVVSGRAGERNGEDRGGRKGDEDEYGNGGGDGTATGAAGKKLDLDAEVRYPATLNPKP